MLAHRAVAGARCRPPVGSRSAEGRGGYARSSTSSPPAGPADGRSGDGSARGSGWVCISADYRLAPAGYGDQLADVRAALAWTRAHAEDHGGNPDKVIVAGGSAGAHLAATAALSGAEVSGVIALYGYYGDAGGSGPEPTSPHIYINADAPPFLIIHGSLDTLVLADEARSFADQLRTVSRQPVAYAELPGAQHNFDFFHSLRFHAVTDAVVRFAQLTVGASTLERLKR